MSTENLRLLTLFVATLLCAGVTAAPAISVGKPTGLQCDSLVTPLGIDDPKPQFSWLLQDPNPGAHQSAYQLQVASSANLLNSDKPDVWDSGKIASNQSVLIPYGGPPLAAEKRYYWRVKAWDRAGSAYPVSDLTWWETGLFSPSNWQAKWIGYELTEHRRLRESGAQWITNADAPVPNEASQVTHNFRYPFTVNKPVKRAILYVAGQDSPGAWVNGTSVLKPQPLPPWQQMSWQTYTRQDITAQVKSGENLLAVGVVRYRIGRGAIDPRTPMSACVYIESADGAITLYTSGSQGWLASLNAEGNWFAPTFDASAWKAAEPFTSRDPTAGPIGHPWPTGPVAALRQTFAVSRPLISARLYATALGSYKFHLNGNTVGDQILSPGWMDFRQRVPYQVYDVTAQVKTGQNAIAAYLAPGWYTTPLMWFRQGYNYGNTPPALKAQLRLEYAGGAVEWINTDASWKASISPYLTAEIYDGETYDARRLQTGWDSAGFTDSEWHAAELITPTEPEIVAQYFPPIREEKALRAVALTSPQPGTYIFDFGQNMAGVPRVQLSGPRGTDVRLRFAEVLNPDGTVYVENLRTAKATDHFILAGKGLETYQPQFTFHGFRYVELSGILKKPSLDAVKAIVFHTDAPFTAEFQSGSKMLNQLWSNIVWGQRSNFVGVPTDCPQRDERLGWTADAQVFWRTAAYNMDLDTFTQKFTADLRGTQVGTAMYGIFAPGTITPSPGFGAGWSDAGVIIPWTGWLQSANKRIIEQNWNAMETYLAAIASANPDFLWRNQFGIPFGDWLTPTQTTPEDLVATAYWAYDVSLMRDMAEATGRQADVQKYSDLFTNIKAAFAKAYVRPDGSVGTVDHYPSIPPPTARPPESGPLAPDAPVETQTGYVLALHMNLLPEDLRAAAAEKLVKKIEENHGLLGTGFLGTPYLLGVLADTGHTDIAYRLLLNTAYPSWGYLIEHGATTTWERWNGDQMRNDPSMNSYNHYAYGAVAEWIYRYAAGIDTTAAGAGFHTVSLHPHFDARLGFLDFAYQSPYGRIASAWKVVGGQVEWKVTVPPNATGLLALSPSEENAYKIDGVALAQSQKLHPAANHSYELPAGSYTFQVALESKVP